MTTVVVVSGVAGSGKTTVGQLLAARLSWPYADADDFHPRSNVDRMAAGRPLTERDRAPWLDAIGRRVDQWLAAGRSGVVSCSAGAAPADIVHTIVRHLPVDSVDRS